MIFWNNHALLPKAYSGLFFNRSEKPGVTRMRPPAFVSAASLLSISTHSIGVINIFHHTRRDRQMAGESFGGQIKRPGLVVPRPLCLTD
jgi:hypothetical protein